MSSSSHAASDDNNLGGGFRPRFLATEAGKWGFSAPNTWEYMGKKGGR